ncbi:MAG: GatB/YqeY domain-containing protein [Microgenomates group bacterium]
MLEEKIRQDLASALKKGETLKVSTLRFLLAEIKNEVMAKQRELTDEEIVAIIRRQIKKREESITAFQQGARDDLVRKEKEEINILSKYLPQQLSSEELEKIIKQAIAEINAKNPADFGRVMGAVMGKVRGQADGSLVSEMVKKELEGNR